MELPINIQNLIAPKELAASASNLNRCLIIGSCLVSGLNSAFKHISGIECDYLQFNNMARLPQISEQEIGKYQFQMVQIPIRSVIRDDQYFRIPYGDQEAHERLLENALQFLQLNLDEALRYNTEYGIDTFLMNFFVPQRSQLGILLPKRTIYNFQHIVQRLNDFLEQYCAERSNVYLLDIDELAQLIGRRHVQDDTLYQMNHGGVWSDHEWELDKNRLKMPSPLFSMYEQKSWDFILALHARVEAMFCAIRRIDAIKLVIVDLDDTIWRGVVAEADDVSPDMVEGWPLGIAEALLNLKKRGIMLAIASKNDESNIQKIWQKLWHGRLGLQDFVSVKINWDRKGDNIEQIISEVNVLPDSVLFIDDNPIERDEIKERFPGIRTLGDELYAIRRILLDAPETQPAIVTEESSRRTEMVRGQIERETTRNTMSREEFLASLNIEIDIDEISEVSHKDFERSFELINKTNQFNTTGVRHERAAFDAWVADGGKLKIATVRDRFTNYGLVAVAMIKGGEIEQLVMSCRVFGLGVEQELMRSVIERRAGTESGAIRGRLIDTGKNKLCSNLFAEFDFEREGDDWVLR